MIIDLFLLLLGIFFLFMIIGRRDAINRNKQATEAQQEEERPLTETQRRWHEMWHQQEIINNMQAAEEFVRKNENVVRKRMEMITYLKENTRPFTFWGWLLEPIDPRMIGIYSKKMLITVGFHIFLWVIFPAFSWSIPAMVSVLFLDYILYKTKLTYEVTIWNPEFNQKFGDLQKLEEELFIK